MVQELLQRNQSQSMYVRALSSAYRNKTQLFEPSIWESRDPETEEKMLRDADISHGVTYRRHLIAGKRWSLNPKSETSERGPMSVAIGTELIKEIENFTSARFGLARAFFSGRWFAKIHGRVKQLAIGDGQVRAWWVPTHLEDIDRRAMRIVPDGQGENLSAHWENWHVGTSEWRPLSRLDAVRYIRHIYQDEQGTTGHGRALREALGWWHYAKSHCLQESLQAVERFAQGIITCKVDGARNADGTPNQTVIQDWVNLLEDMRARHVLVYDAKDQVEHIQMNGEGWQLLEKMRAELRSTILTLILGANLTTSADKGGSYALAEVQENSTEALIQFDRELLEQTLTKNLLGCIWFKNHANLVDLGIAEEQPRFVITQEKLQNPIERANVAAILNGMGVDLSREDVMEQAGFRMIEPGEDFIPGATAQPAALPGFDFGASSKK